MATLKELQKSNDMSTLRRISKNENLAFAYSLYDFLVSDKYNSEVDFDVYLPTKGLICRDLMFGRLNSKKSLSGL